MKKKIMENSENGIFTFSYIKPDAIAHWDKIYETIKKNGFQILESKVHKMEDEEVDELYYHLKNEKFFNDMKNFLLSKPVIMFFLQKKNAVKAFRELIGATNPAEAEEGTIRKIYGTPNGGHLNAIHGSDCDEAAKNETELFFPYMNYLWQEYIGK